ncbi:unnamed protein product [Lathyrus oleraceus]
MASSSKAQNVHMIVNSVKSMTIKSKTMHLNQDDLKLLVEQIVDFDSFSQNGYNLCKFFIIQEWSLFFNMLDGPTYPHLVKDLKVREEDFDESATCEELRLMVIKDNSLTGKTRKEVGLKKFEKVLIRSGLMGTAMVITQKMIAKLFRTPNSSRFVVGMTTVLKHVQSSGFVLKCR